MVFKSLVFLIAVCFDLLASASSVECPRNSSRVYLNLGESNLRIDDFYFRGDEYVSSEVSCKLFLKSNDYFDQVGIKFKRLLYSKNVRLLGNQVIEACERFQSCRFKLSTLLARPQLILSEVRKILADRIKPRGKPISVAKNIADFSGELFTITSLDQSFQPVDYLQNNLSSIRYISTMSLDKDAMDVLVEYLNHNPNTHLDIYFSPQIQYFRKDVAIEQLANFKNVLLHPISTSPDISSSFHIKGIVHQDLVKSALFTLNLKKSQKSPQDLLFSFESKRVASELLNQLKVIDDLNCRHFEASAFFNSFFPRYKLIRDRYQHFCKKRRLRVGKGEQPVLSLFDFSSIPTLRGSKSSVYTHFFNPSYLQEFTMDSIFYIAHLSKKSEDSRIKINKDYHYKLIFHNGCVYWMTSNLTPTSIGNKGEFAFKLCDSNQYNLVKNKIKEIRGIF
jgi:hypothetical protein